MLQAAEDHYRRQARLSALAVRSAQQTWDRLDLNNLDGSWRALAPRMVAQVSALQLISARDADPYLTAVLREQGLSTKADGRVRPSGFVGVAGDGRSLATLLREPLIGVKVAIADGAAPPDAMASGRSSVALMTATALQDTGRAAVSAGMGVRQVTGYVRMLNPPSCSRCAVLAGKFYRYNTGFQRHPRCDCRHIPSTEDRAGDLRTDPLAAIRAGQVAGLSKADTTAILRDGADVSKVINAHRGMSTAQVFGQKLKVTTEAARGTVRLRPESIYRIATDRAEAQRLLKAHGYIL
jgi:hypothetical protein